MAPPRASASAAADANRAAAVSRALCASSRIAAAAAGSIAGSTAGGGKNADANVAHDMPPRVVSACAAYSARVVSSGGAMRKLERHFRNSARLSAPSPSSSRDANARRVAAPPAANFAAIFSRRSLVTAGAVPAAPASVDTNGADALADPTNGADAFADPPRAASSPPRVLSSAGKFFSPRIAVANSRKSIAPSPSTSNRVMTASRISSVETMLNLSSARRTPSRFARVPLAQSDRNAFIAWCPPARDPC